MSQICPACQSENVDARFVCQRCKTRLKKISRPDFAAVPRTRVPTGERPAYSEPVPFEAPIPEPELPPPDPAEVDAQRQEEEREERMGRWIAGTILVIPVLGVLASAAMDTGTWALVALALAEVVLCWRARGQLHYYGGRARAVRHYGGGLIVTGVIRLLLGTLTPTALAVLAAWVLLGIGAGRVAGDYLRLE